MRIALIMLALWLTLDLQASEGELVLNEPMIPHIRMSGELRLTDVRGRITNVDLPHVPGLTLALNRSTYRQINDTVILSIDVQASATGRYAIPGFQVTTSEQTIQIPATSVAVEGPNPMLQDTLASDVWVSAPEVLVGQTFEIRQRIYLPRRSSQTVLDPDAPQVGSGLRITGEGTKRGAGWAVDLNGRPWRVTTWVWPVDALAAGDWTIRAQAATAERDRFGRMQFAEQVAAQQASVVVIDLPAANRPDDFSGMVGRPELTAQLDRSYLRVGESTRLEVIVSGPQAELLPELTLPDLGEILVYPVPSEPGDRQSGQLIQRWDLAPTTAGSLELTPPSISYYDPASNGYRRTDTTPLLLEVAPGRNAALTIAGHTRTSPPDDTIPSELTSNHLASGSSLPSPLRQRVANPPRWWLGPATFLGLAVATFALCLVGHHWRQRAGSDPHKDLRKALQRQDQHAIVRALEQLAKHQPQLASQAQSIAARIERARYGDGDVDTALAAAADLCRGRLSGEQV